MAVPRLGSLLMCRKMVTSVSTSRQQLSTTPALLEYFFTKKHEWVNVEGNKGCSQVHDNYQNIIFCHIQQVLWVYLPTLQIPWGISCSLSYLYQEPPSLPGRSAGCWSLSRLPQTSSVQSPELSQRRTRLWRMVQTSSTTVHWKKVGCSSKSLNNSLLLIFVFSSHFYHLHIIIQM